MYNHRVGHKGAYLSSSLKYYPENINMTGSCRAVLELLHLCQHFGFLKKSVFIICCVKV